MIYSWSGTGQDVYNHPDVSFPGRTPSVVGTSLVFGTGDNNAKLFEFPLVSSGILSPADPAVVLLSVDLTRVTSDYDPVFGVSDGTTCAAFLTTDAGATFATNAQDVGTTLLHGQGDRTTLFTDAPYPPVGSSFEVNATFTLQDTLTNVAVVALGDAGNADKTAIDWPEGFSLVFASMTASEEYQLNSLSVEVNGTVIPEPTSLVVLGLGVAGLALRRRRKQLSN